MVGPDYDSIPISDTPYYTNSFSQDAIYKDCEDLLCVVLEVGFRLVVHSPNQLPALPFNHTFPYNWVFETVFLKGDDIISDAMCMWIVSGCNHPEPILFMGYFVGHLERDMPFSQRLRQTTIRAIECTLDYLRVVPGLEAVRLLNRLNVAIEDMKDQRRWTWLFLKVICSSKGPEGLSPHYWHLLGGLERDNAYALPEATYNEILQAHSAVMLSLKRDREWEKLQVWMLVVWRILPLSKLTEDVQQVTVELLSQQWPSALLEFEDRCERWKELRNDRAEKLQQICNHVRMEQMDSESPLL